MKLILVLLFCAILSGCASVAGKTDFEAPLITQSQEEEFKNILPPKDGHIYIAVYGFKDKTGQRKPSDRIAHISTAVTQGAADWVIKSLKEVGGGSWFKVIERVGLDNLAKERQIIRQQRQQVDDKTVLKPLKYAGVILEGAIIGYDSNIKTGGSGARYLGIGLQQEYREDIMTISMRIVSTQTGEVLLAVSGTKTILSYGSSVGVFKFIDMGTRAVEIDAGSYTNEPTTLALQRVIDACILELIKQGKELGYWDYLKPVESVVLTERINNVVETLSEEEMLQKEFEKDLKMIEK